MNLDDFSVQVDEETRAINPQTALDEQNAFIGNLRNIQNQQNAEIRQQTHDLGTDIPSNLGGLTGGEGYFNARFQQPFTNAAVGDLRAAAQAQALSEAFDLELARANARYKSAYDAYRKRAGSGGGGGGNNPTGGNDDGDVDFESPDKKKVGSADEVYETINKDAVKRNELANAKNQIINNSILELQRELRIAEEIKKERKKK